MGGLARRRCEVCSGTGSPDAVRPFVGLCPACDGTGTSGERTRVDESLACLADRRPEIDYQGEIAGPGDELCGIKVTVRSPPATVVPSWFRIDYPEDAQ